MGENNFNFRERISKMQMKLFIAVCLLAVASANMISEEKCQERRSAVTKEMRREIIEKDMKATKCMFKSEDEMVSCKKGEEIVECKSVRDVSLLSDEELEKMPKISILGIGMVDKESKRFPLFPRFVNETIYRPATCEQNKLPIVFGCGKKFASAIGLRVEDCKCFEKLSVMLKVAAKEPFMGEVKDMEEKVEMISEMLIMDKDLEKRFLWGGWGLGYSGLGFGWGGLGWGGLGWGWGGLGGWGWGK